MERIDPALGLTLERSRTLAPRRRTLCIGVPAHNEAATIGAVVASAREALEVLAVAGEVIVAASACSDGTGRIARRAGAEVIDVARGKGRAVTALLRRSRADVLCLLDADVEYFGAEPLAATVARPVVDGLADAALADMYWRPVYPQMWLYGFFAPLMGRLYPEALAQLGPSPWTGQRAAVRALWPEAGLPAGFTVEMALNLAWLRSARRIAAVPSDDWVNPQRPKPGLMRAELELILEAADADGRLEERRDAYRRWFAGVHRAMARYLPARHDVSRFEQELLREARATLPPGSRPVADPVPAV